MVNNRTSMSDQEFTEIIRSRVRIDMFVDSKSIHFKTIDFPVHLNRPLSYNSERLRISNLNISDCIFKKDIIIGDYICAGHISFTNCIFEEDVIMNSLENVTIKEDCQFKKNLTISIPNYKDVKISNLFVNKKLTINGSSPMEVFISNINVESQIAEQEIVLNIRSHKLIVENIYYNILNLSGGISHGLVLLKQTNGTELLIEREFLESTMFIQDSKIDELSFKKLMGNIKQLCISNCPQITNLHLPLDKFSKSEISNCIITKLELIGTNKKENIINIEKATINQLTFFKVFNEGIITLRQLSIPRKGIVTIKSSNLGKTEFIYCDFSKAVLEFENNKITEVFFSETDFPKTISLDNAKNHIQAQLAFGQLATAFQKQGDTIRAVEYQSREIEAHYKSLPWGTKDFFKKLNLWLNKISNNFGRYWMQGVIFSFGIGLLFFSFLLISTNKYSFSFPTIDITLLPAYLKFMNPLRFIDTETLFKTSDNNNIKLSLTSWSYLWDFLGRIFVAYGYYQTIQAFRRFGRK